MNMNWVSVNSNWSIKRVSFSQSRDRLALLPDGRLRHYIQNPDSDDSDAFNIDMDNVKESFPMHDYSQGKYCMDRVRD